MGRHGRGPSRRRGASWPLVAICVLVVAAVGFGFWLWSVRSAGDPIDASPVDAYAVVVSSPGCTAGSGSTVVDLNLDTAVRSSLSACGRRVGERIAVQYLAGHTDQARLAGTAVAHNNSAGRWLPIAILAAGLLAVVGTLSLLIDRHRSRHDGGSAGAVPRPTVAQLRAAAAQTAPVRSRSADAPNPATVTGVTPVPVGDDEPDPPAGPDPDATTGPDPAPVTTEDPAGVAAFAGAPPGPSRARHAADDAGADTTTRIASGAVPGIGSTPLRPSDIVDEDLFTHRTHHPAE